MTTQTHNDYARIKSKLDIQLREHQQQIEQAQGHIGELQDELNSIGQHIATIQGEQIAAQSESARLHKLVAEAARECELAEGTSLYSAKTAALSHLQSELATVMKSVEDLQQPTRMTARQPRIRRTKSQHSHNRSAPCKRNTRKPGLPGHDSTSSTLSRRAILAWAGSHRLTLKSR